jgi:hypothetical protein
LGVPNRPLTSWETSPEGENPGFRAEFEALILGPGGYCFDGYWRFGLPLEIIVIAVAIPVILLVGPL